jgi:hypothetical protein
VAGESRAAGGETAGGRESWPAGRLLGIILGERGAGLGQGKMARGRDKKTRGGKKMGASWF